MVNGACKYSYTCNKVNQIPKNTVLIKPTNPPNLSPAIRASCAQVQVAPEVNKINVFNNGISQGFKISKPAGGKTPPISCVGPKLEWKNAQKKPKKNIISDTINKIIPIFNPF